jgi:phosphate-selective porin OprO and OprP
VRLRQRALGKIVVVALFALRARVAVAQQTQPASPPVTAGWQDGFFIQSANGDYRLNFGMVGQADARLSIDDPTPITNTFTVRKLRPTFTGRLGRFFDFKVMPDFGNGTAVVQDMYLDVRFSPAFRVRTGKDKTPVGYELLIGDAFLFFPERAQATNLVPNRDNGVQVQGDLGGGKLLYTGGVFNGIPDGSSSTTEVDANNGKDLAGRIAWQPFRSATAPGVMNGFGVHVGGSSGMQEGAQLPSFRTSVGQVYFSYDRAAAAAGRRNRVSPAVFYYYKRFGGFAEFMQSSQRVARDVVARDVTNRAWEVTGSYVLTGEAASDRNVRPRENFDPTAGHWGALQVLGRYTELYVDQGIFDAGFAAAGASGKARSFTAAANWYPNIAIKYYFTFERTMFDAFTGGAERASENVFLLRAQIGF